MACHATRKSTVMNEGRNRRCGGGGMCFDRLEALRRNGRRTCKRYEEKGDRIVG